MTSEDSELNDSLSLSLSFPLSLFSLEAGNCCSSLSTLSSRCCWYRGCDLCPVSWLEMMQGTGTPHLGKSILTCRSGGGEACGRCTPDLGPRERRVSASQQEALCGPPGPQQGESMKVTSFMNFVDSLWVCDQLLISRAGLCALLM